MGTGSSKGLGANKPGGVRSINLPNGETIFLKDVPLKYGDKDPYLSSELRQTMEEYEDSIREKNLEHFTAYDNMGVSTIAAGEVVGKHDSVVPPKSAYDGALAATHNHARDPIEEAGMLGGTFSSDDLQKHFANKPITTLRASTIEGTYSISKTADFKKWKAKMYFARVTKERKAEYKAELKQIKQNYRKGKIDYNKADKQQTAAFNNWMANLHNDLLAGQESCGYFYTLERR